MYWWSGSRVDVGEQRRAISSFVLVADGAQQGRAGILRLRSTLTESWSLLFVSNSSQAPRFGITLAEAGSRPVVGSSVLAEVDARASGRAGDDDALGAVDDERALVGHQREVAHEDPLALDLAGLLDEELDVDVERAR